MIPDHILKRKGASKPSNVPQDVLLLLNQGEIETVNLSEWLIVDQIRLLKTFLAQNQLEILFEPIQLELLQLKKITATQATKIIGLGLAKFSNSNQKSILLHHLQQHQSDSVRCWGCYFEMEFYQGDLAVQSLAIKKYASDSHFGVRELAWMAYRHYLVLDLHLGIKLLHSFTFDKDENVRRFTSEATRPRGVWCSHIDELKRNPSLALAILEPLKSDESKYIQNSVANWLNDASKTAPEFVIEICQSWLQQSDTIHTKYIVKRALRTLETKKDFS